MEEGGRSEFIERHGEWKNERDEERNSMRMRGKREMKHEKPVQIEHG